VGAVNERITVATIGGIKQLSPAVATGSDIRQNVSASLAFGAGSDGEFFQADRVKVADLQAGDASRRRSLFLNPAAELFERRERAFYLNVQSLRSILNESPQAQLPGEAVHERAKTDSLYGSGDLKLETKDFWRHAVAPNYTDAVNTVLFRSWASRRNRHHWCIPIPVFAEVWKIRALGFSDRIRFSTSSTRN
jgi:hypothetical protein